MAAPALRDRPVLAGRRRLATRITIVLLLAVAGAIVVVQAWHGPIILWLSASHGIDAGDLLAFPAIVLAIALARSEARQRDAEGEERASLGRRAVPASAIALGVLLLLAGVVAKAGGGPLVPTGGGTLDGTIDEASGTTAVPVDHWSYLALTYDGATLRLYVDGRLVSSHDAKGSIQTPDTPLWIGGNRPYGEHFHGRIDEVRVYNRALGQDEIRSDMEMPVMSARGLVAGYGFASGSGSTAADSSGEDNDGAIRGATWVRGRYGKALNFNGVDAVVRVPGSASLDLDEAMTLSGWIRPSERQSGWRTVVQRQTDAYLLTASSDRQDRTGGVDDLRAALIIAAAIWFCVLIASALAPRSARRRHWWLPVGLFVLGSFVDAALAPSGTLVGPTLVALWLAATASSRIETVSFLLAAGVFSGLTIASLEDLAGLQVVLSRAEGAIARTAALGVLFLLGGLQSLPRSAFAKRRA
jgi:hypothetical protein